MQVGEEDQIFAKMLELAGDWFFDLDHHVGFLPSLGSGVDNLRPGLLIVFVVDRGKFAGAALN